MLSKTLQKLYIWQYCDCRKDSKRYRKLMEYRKSCNNIECMKNAEKDTTSANHFMKMGLSPLYCSDKIGYIPSFKNLLDGTEDERVRAFLEIQYPALLL